MLLTFFLAATVFVLLSFLAVAVKEIKDLEEALHGEQDSNHTLNARLLTLKPRRDLKGRFQKQTER